MSPPSSEYLSAGGVPSGDRVVRRNRRLQAAWGRSGTALTLVRDEDEAVDHHGGGKEEAGGGERGVPRGSCGAVLTAHFAGAGHAEDRDSENDGHTNTR